MWEMSQEGAVEHFLLVILGLAETLCERGRRFHGEALKGLNNLRVQEGEDRLLEKLLDLWCLPRFHGLL
jgi:hypothetical protein